MVGSSTLLAQRLPTLPRHRQYGAAKAGVENLTATMAVEWGHLGIRVNAIAPGIVRGDAMRRRHEHAGPRPPPGRDHPLRRLGTPDDIGPLCVYFAAEESSWITGTVVQATGGSRIPVGLLTYLHHVNERMNAREDEAAGAG